MEKTKVKTGFGAQTGAEIFFFNCVFIPGGLTDENRACYLLQFMLFCKKKQPISDF